MRSKRNLTAANGRMGLGFAFRDPRKLSIYHFDERASQFVQQKLKQESCSWKTSLKHNDRGMKSHIKE